MYKFIVKTLKLLFVKLQLVFEFSLEILLFWEKLSISVTLYNTYYLFGE